MFAEPLRNDTCVNMSYTVTYWHEKIGGGGGELGGENNTGAHTHLAASEADISVDAS